MLSFLSRRRRRDSSVLDRFSSCNRRRNGSRPGGMSSPGSSLDAPQPIEESDRWRSQEKDLIAVLNYEVFDKCCLRRCIKKDLIAVLNYEVFDKCRLRRCIKRDLIAPLDYEILTIATFIDASKGLRLLTASHVSLVDNRAWGLALLLHFA